MPEGISTITWLATTLFAVSIVFAEPTHREPGQHPPSQEITNPIELSEASARQGRSIFERFCVTCHGLKGDGKTDMAENLNVPLPDFTNDKWKFGGTDGEIYSLIQNGSENGMEAYKERFNRQRTWHLVNYIRTLSPKSKIQLEAQPVPENPIEYNIKSLKRGRILYENHCAICHAEDGAGYTDYLEFLPVPPADLTTGVFRYGTRDGDLFNIIRNGTENGMEAFNDKLSADDIWYTVNYIRRFSR